MRRDTLGGRGALLAIGLVCLAAGAGCSSGSATAAGGGTVPGASCGMTRTGANVPVYIRVAKGTVSCGTAMRIENEYAAIIKAGKVEGNGGGAPVQVSGWICQGYPTPHVLSTGNASECHTATDEVFAVLAVGSSGATPGAG